jgi:hypothetical protein
LEHWHRIERWRERLRAVPDDDTADFLDFSIVVLLHCFAMRDWLLKSGVADPQVRTLFDSAELKVCRDLANGTKHLSISQPSVDAHHQIRREHRLWRRPGESEGELKVFAGDVSYSLRDLCGECVRQIGAFIATLPPGQSKRSPDE